MYKLDDGTYLSSATVFSEIANQSYAPARRDFSSMKVIPMDDKMRKSHEYFKALLDNEGGDALVQNSLASPAPVAIIPNLVLVQNKG